MTPDAGGVEACLPAELRGPATTITRMSAGLPGAGVYRVAAGGNAFVLKVAGFVADHGFIAMHWNPGTRDAAIRQLGENVRRIQRTVR